MINNKKVNFMKKIKYILALILLASPAYSAGKVKVCTQKCEKITEKHFIAHYKKLSKTEKGRKEVEARIKDVKRKMLEQKGKKYKEKNITANCKDMDDLSLISKASLFNNQAATNAKNKLINSPFKYSIICIRQCRTGEFEEGEPKVFYDTKKSDGE